MAAISEPVPLVLRAGGLEAGLAPAIGGSLAFLRRGGIDLMRPLAPEAAARGDVLGVASFPMLPYANRIDGNRFTFESETFRVAANNPPERFNVHGSGWRSAWTVAEASATAALLVLDHEGGDDDPYRYRATQAFSLGPAGLSVAMSIENTGVSRMPFGFGHHPWFLREPGITLAFRARHFWLEAPDGVAGDRIGLPPELDFSGGAALPRGWRNNCYGGWDGLAEIRFPARGLGLKLTADPIFGFLMLYADPAKPFFCLEPQSNAACAFNKAEQGETGLGILVLAPGESAGGTIRFEPFAL
jgi:aldose 1-epimerase